MSVDDETMENKPVYPDLEKERQKELLKALRKRTWRTPNFIAERIGDSWKNVVRDLAKLEAYPFVTVRPEGEGRRYRWREYKIDGEIARRVTNND